MHHKSHVCRPAEAGLELLLTVPTAYPPQQAKVGLAGDPGRGGLNNFALAGLGLGAPHVTGHEFTHAVTREKTTFRSAAGKEIIPRFRTNVRRAYLPARLQPE